MEHGPGPQAEGSTILGHQRPRPHQQGLGDTGGTHRSAVGELPHSRELPHGGGGELPKLQVVPLGWEVPPRWQLHPGGELQHLPLDPRHHVPDDGLGQCGGEGGYLGGCKGSAIAPGREGSSQAATVGGTAGTTKGEFCVCGSRGSRLGKPSVGKRALG